MFMFIKNYLRNLGPTLFRHIKNGHTLYILSKWILFLMMISLKLIEKPVEEDTPEGGATEKAEADPGS